MLAHNDALNKLFVLDIIAAMSNISSGLTADDGPRVTEKDVQAAFQGSEHMIYIKDVLGDDSNNTTHVLRFYKARVKNNENDDREYSHQFVVGRFKSDRVALGQPWTRTVRVGEMAGDVKQSLKSYLDEKTSATKKRKAADEDYSLSKVQRKKQKKKKKSPVVESEDDRKKRELEETERRDKEEKERREQLEKEKNEAKRLKLLKRSAKLLEQKQTVEDELAKVREEMAALNSQSNLGSISTRTPPMEVKVGGRRLFYILDGRAGFIHYPDGMACVLPTEIAAGLYDLPDGYDGDDYSSKMILQDRAYELQSYGPCQFFLPTGASFVANNWQVRKDKSHEIMQKLEYLFSGEKSSFDEESLRISAAFNVQGYGASDEATEMIIVGWTKALLHELGIDHIDAANIAKACPSRRTWVRNEAGLAADCMMVILQEIVDDGAKTFALITDHGKRAGLEHFVKILVWMGKDDEDNTKRVLKFHCLDVDTSAHDAQGCAEAVKKSLEEFTKMKDFNVIAVTGDAGGGASVQNLLPALIKIGAVDDEAVKINCLMHALNKCLESAGQDTFGSQGVNNRTPYQLLYVFNQLWKAIKEEGGSEGKSYLDDIYSLVVDKLLSDESWQREAKKNFKQAFSKLRKVLDDLEDLDDDAGIDDLIHFITETPGNIQDPVFSRWKTVMSCTRVVLDYWSQIYFVAVAIKQHQIYQKKHNSYLCTLSSTLLSLMKEKGTNEKDAYYDPESDEDLVVDEFDGELYMVENQATAPLKRNDTPVFYAMLLFFRGFGDVYFDDMFNFCMKDDPILGTGSFGQISRFCVERCFIMHKLLDDIQNGQWIDRAEFKGYKIALEGVNNKKEFDNMTTIFFQRFRNMFDKHVYPCWSSDTILPYIIGGDPTLAKEFARWLIDYDVMMSNEGGDDDNDDTHEFTFTDKEIDMGDFHYRHVAEKHVKINVRECMEYLTANADRSAIMSSPFVKGHWDQIEKLGMCGHVVSPLQKSTWGQDANGNPYDFTELSDAIWNEISIHSNHQQRCENYVQLAALVSQTKVGEVRRTLRAIILSTIIRPFHIWAKEQIMERNPDRKKPPRRVEGTIRSELLIEFVTRFRQKLKRAKQLMGIDRYEAIRKKLIDRNMKTSARYRNENKEKFMESLENMTRKTTKSEEAVGRYDKTVLTEGGISFKLLTLINSCKGCNTTWKKRKYHDCKAKECAMAAVHAELKHYNVVLSKKKQCGLSLMEKRHLLRDEVAKVKIVGQRKGQQGYDIKDIKYFVPQTELGKSLLLMQLEMMNVEKGIST